MHNGMLYQTKSEIEKLQIVSNSPHSTRIARKIGLSWEQFYTKTPL